MLRFGRSACGVAAVVMAVAVEVSWSVLGAGAGGYRRTVSLCGDNKTWLNRLSTNPLHEIFDNKKCMAKPATSILLVRSFRAKRASG